MRPPAPRHSARNRAPPRRTPRTRVVLPAAAGAVLGAVLVNAPAAHAEWPTFDAITHFLITQLQNAATQAINKVESAVTSIGTQITDRITGLDTSLNDVLSRGFSQVSNYQRASVGAQQQIADASNMANARVQRDFRNAQIADEHVAGPNACAALDGGVATVAAGVQGYAVAATIARIHDLRGAAGQGMPSYNGAAQGVASMAQLHLASYCDAIDAAAGLCPAPSQTPNADQQASSLWSGGSYADQAGVTAAKDYATLLVQPVAPAAIRGDALASQAGQEAALRRRAYNARVSLATTYVDRAIGMQTPSVPLSPVQQAWLAAQGLPPQQNGSWLQVAQIEAERRVGDVAWNANLEAAPPASVSREIARQQALTNYLLFQILKDGLQRGAIAAASLAADVERNHEPAVRMPSPDFR